MHHRLLTAGLVLAFPLTACAQNASVLDGRDDVTFARALVENGYPDLAEHLLVVMDNAGSAGGQAEAPIAALRLDVAQDAAMKIEDLIKRKDALLKVLADKEKFISAFKGAAAEDIRNALPDLCNLIGETITAAIKRETDEKVREALRTQGAAIFLKAEQAMKERIAELGAIRDPTEVDEVKLASARYNLPRTIYYHSLLFPPGSAERKALCTDAVREFDEFMLDYEGGDNLLPYFANIEYGLSLKELEKPDEGIKRLDQTIDLRESWGERDESGFWPVPESARDIVDLVCYATLQKLVVLREQKKFEDVVKTGRDYFRSTQEPFGAPSSMLLAKELGEAQIATGDVRGAVATAASMIHEDPDGYGGWLGRELLGRATK